MATLIHPLGTASAIPSLLEQRDEFFRRARNYRSAAANHDRPLPEFRMLGERRHRLFGLGEIGRLKAQRLEARVFAHQPGGRLFKPGNQFAQRRTAGRIP
jgi:hypothetical protein